MLRKTKILEVGITAEKPKKILEYLLQQIAEGKRKLMIVTPNPEMLVYAHHHPTFKKLLNEADLALNDGVGLGIAAKILGVRLSDRLTGTDFIDAVCRVASTSRLFTEKKPMSMGFFGGRGRVAELTAECLQQRYPHIKVIFAGSEWKQPRENIDMLFVAYGVPKQEKWISANLSKINVRAAIGVGGAFDYYSKKIPRAPLLMRKAGLEWLFRLIVQPWRIRRQFAIIHFLYLVIKKKISLT